MSFLKLNCKFGENDDMSISDLSLEKRKKVSEIIQAARVQKGISQSDLANIAGCSRSTIARIESNTFSPNADQLYAIIEALGLKMQIGDIVI